MKAQGSRRNVVRLYLFFVFMATKVSNQQRGCPMGSLFVEKEM